ncbi:MAG: CpcT/CpeT family chromophore lyase, partial [Cyanobacteria bacterium J06607_13]
YLRCPPYSNEHSSPSFNAPLPVNDTLLLKTYDKGIDPDTGRGLWGALMGPFQMVKQKTFSW